MTPSRPAVSVVMNTHNGMAFLPDTFRSLFAQRFRDFEVVVADDASTDGTPAWLRSVGDPRLRIFSLARRQGISRAKNHALWRARGRWITFFDQDDVMLPDALGCRVRWLNAHPQAEAVFTTVRRLIDARDLPLPPRPFLEDTFRLYRFWKRIRRLDPGVLPAVVNLLCPLQSLLVSAGAVRRTGGLNPRLAIANDWEYLLRLSQTTPIYFLDRPTLKYRLHAGNFSIPQTPKGCRRILEDQRYLYRRYPGPLKPLTLRDVQLGVKRLRRAYPSIHITA